MSETTLSDSVALISLTGFAVQQGLQVLDLPITLIARLVARLSSRLAIGEADVKKSLMQIGGLMCGLVIADRLSIGLLRTLDPKSSGALDTLMTGLAIGAGTEGMNSVIKFAGYVKDARKIIEVSVVPATTDVAKDRSVKLLATVANAADPSVYWEVLEGSGGEVASDGTYTAPAQPGVYHVVAASRADPSRRAIATIRVS